MNFYFNQNVAAEYRSKSQKICVMTEDWLGNNTYCPSCGHQPIQSFTNNRPVADFFCPKCHEQFELKSKSGQTTGRKIADGAYRTMIERIQSDDNPNFFFLAYRRSDYSVQQLMLVPKHFITPAMIIRRKPVPETAKRAGWVGCTMDIGKLPESGKIFLIKNQSVVKPETVRAQWQSNLFLRGQKHAKRGWLLAIMRCLDRLPEYFSLAQLYEFEQQLSIEFPENDHIKDKIRQQLQLLRDRGVIEFLGGGRYRKMKMVV